MIINSLIIALTISLLIQVFFFLFAFFYKTDKVTDLSYGATFIVLSLFFLVKNNTYSLVEMTIVFLVTVWGLRLAWYLLQRIIKMGRDKRFDEIREKPLKLVSFWLMQAVVVWLIFIPVAVVLSSVTKNPSTATAVGVLLWLSGFLIELISDQQKFLFKKQYPNEFISTGLWRYSRHPNYFGEVLLWWGVFIVATPFLDGWLWLSIIGPLTISFVILFVSGIPVIEKSYDKKYGGRKDYREYKRSTSLFIPLPKAKRSQILDSFLLF